METYVFEVKKTVEEIKEEIYTEGLSKNTPISQIACTVFTNTWEIIMPDNVSKDKAYIIEESDGSYVYVPKTPFYNKELLNYLRLFKWFPKEPVRTIDTSKNY